MSLDIESSGTLDRKPNNKVDTEEIVDGAVTDPKISSITTRSKLPSLISYEDENNTFSQTNDFIGTIKVPRKTDPASPSTGEIWINGKDLKYRDNQAAPVTQTIEIQSNKDVPNGYAGLDASGKLSMSELPTHDNTKHVTGVPIGLGDANFEGTSIAVARADHVHKRDIKVAKNNVDVGIRNKINFIEGSNITITTADDATNDKVDVMVSSIGDATGLDDLSDVTIDLPLKNHFLWFDGTQWINKKVYLINAAHFGAVGDGATDNTDVFRTLLENTTLDNNPELPIYAIYIPAGVYLTQQLKIKGPKIIVGDGWYTVIKRIVDPDLADTYSYKPTDSIHTSDNAYIRSFISGYDATVTDNNKDIIIKDIAFDCNGYAWGNTPDKPGQKRSTYQLENFGLYFKRTRNMSLFNVAVYNSMNFSVSFREVTTPTFISNLYIHGDTEGKVPVKEHGGSSNPSGMKRWNQDGLHLMGCENFVINNLWVYSTDDSLVIRSLETPSKNITVNNAILSNIGAGRCVYLQLGGKSLDTGSNQKSYTMENIHLNNIVCKEWNNNCIMIESENPSGNKDSLDNQYTLYLRNVTIHATIFGTKNGSSTAASKVYVVHSIPQGDIGSSPAVFEDCNIDINYYSSVNDLIDTDDRVIQTDIAGNQNSIIRGFIFNVNAYVKDLGTNFVFNKLNNSIIRGVIQRMGGASTTTVAVNNCNQVEFDLLIRNVDNSTTGTGYQKTDTTATNTDLIINTAKVFLTNKYVTGIGSGVQYSTSAL